MEYIDHTYRRIVLSFVTGLAAGAITATRRGLPLRNTTFIVGLNWGLVASVLSGTERLSYALLNQLPQLSLERDRKLYASHTMGGFFGGSLLAVAYLKPPLTGGIAFTPVMLAIAWGENTFLDAKTRKLQEYLDNIHQDENKNSTSSQDFET
jgi:hypothetical protein